MASQQLVHILSVNGQIAGTPVLGFPTATPTLASPCPQVGLLSAQMQGVSPVTSAITAQFPGANAQLNYTYFNKGQRITTGVYVSETVSTVVTAS